jgi:hypothetical protein
MIPSENLVVCGEGGLGERECFGRRADLKQQATQIATLASGSWVFGAKHFFKYRQSALHELPRTRKVTLFNKQIGKVAKARCRVGMLGTERLFAYCQRALQEPPCALSDSWMPPALSGSP